MISFTTNRKENFKDFLKLFDFKSLFKKTHGIFVIQIKNYHKIWSYDT